ncbi:STAS domain-containing protein [Chryseobacterium ureilyticum]|uniref:STAS domain-containing protein n=1 Tax=Chryseobacterium ureilyticum TaxID=373668 RepID=A0A1N7QDL5_9FLAO|nr:STAS domain-containing protein [Chryseobacterium ureilyticum]
MPRRQHVIRNYIRIRKFFPFKNFKEFYNETRERAKYSKIIEPCQDFRLINNPIEVIKTIAELKSLAKREKIHRVIIDLTNLTHIDIGAISLMLSSVKELRNHKVRISGTQPLDEDVLDFIIKSGFFGNMSNVSPDISNTLQSHKKNNKNTLIIADCNMKGRGQLIGTNIKQIRKLLLGEENHYQPLYTILMEMNANAFEHAYNDDKKHWVLGINFDEKSKKVFVTFTDNGLGIIQQLNLKRSTRVKEFISDFALLKTPDVFNNGILLQKVFDKVYNSRFKSQINRNRGLPTIKDKNIKNQIKNLICITNNVYLDLTTDKYIILDDDFTGTFYYLELEAENFNQWIK